MNDEELELLQVIREEANGRMGRIENKLDKVEAFITTTVVSLVKQSNDTTDHKIELLQATVDSRFKDLRVIPQGTAAIISLISAITVGLSVYFITH